MTVTAAIAAAAGRGLARIIETDGGDEAGDKAVPAIAGVGGSARR